MPLRWNAAMSGGRSWTPGGHNFRHRRVFDDSLDGFCWENSQETPIFNGKNMEKPWVSGLSIPRKPIQFFMLSVGQLWWTVVKKRLQHANPGVRQQRTRDNNNCHMVVLGWRSEKEKTWDDSDGDIGDMSSTKLADVLQWNFTWMIPDAGSCSLGSFGTWRGCPQWIRCRWYGTLVVGRLRIVTTLDLPMYVGCWSVGKLGY